MIPTAEFKFHGYESCITKKSSHGFEFAYGACATCNAKDLQSFKYWTVKTSRPPYIETDEGRVFLPAWDDLEKKPRIYQFAQRIACEGRGREALPRRSASSTASPASPGGCVPETGHQQREGGAHRQFHGSVLISF